QSPMLSGASGTLSLAGLLILASPRRRRRLYMLTALTIVSMGAAITGALTGCGGSSAKTTNLVLTSARTKAASGSAVTLHATVASTDKLTGTVSFYDGTTAIGTRSTVANITATLSTSSL